MRILLVSQPRDPIVASRQQRGSLALVVRELAHTLANRHEVVIVAPRAFDQLDEEIAPDGVRILRVPAGARQLNRILDLFGGQLSQPRPHLLSASYHAAYQRAVVRTVARLRPDVVHVMTLGSLVERLAATLPTVPRILHLQDEFLLHFDREQARRRLAAADAILVPSTWLARAFATSFPDLATKLHVLPNGVDTERFRPASPGPGGHETRLLFVGRLSPEKGVHVAVAAFALLARERPELVLELVGEAGLMPYAYLACLPRTPALDRALAFYGRGRLERLYSELVLRGRAYLEPILTSLAPELRVRIRLSGPIAHDLLPDTYRAATLLLAPSVWEEPFGIPVVEAMASGVAVVASESGAFPELLGEGETPAAGMLVPKGDAEALAHTVASLLADHERRRRMGEAGRKRAEAAFAWPVIGTQWERLLARIARAHCAA